MTIENRSVAFVFCAVTMLLSGQVAFAAAGTLEAAPALFDPRIGIPAPAGPYPLPKRGVYYAAPDGTDAGDGTARSPWSLAWALGERGAPAGSTVVLRGGIYRPGDWTTVSRPLTLQAARGEKPWLLGSVSLPEAGRGWTPVRRDGGRVVWYTPWDHKVETFAYMKQNPKTYLSPEHPSAADGDMVFVSASLSDRRRTPLPQVGGGSQPGVATLDAAEDSARAHNLGDDWFWIDTAAKRLYLSVGKRDPGRLAVECTRDTTGLYFGPGAAGATLRGVGVGLFGLRGVVVDAKATGVTLEDCAVVWNGVMGVNTNGARGVLRRCRVACNGEQGASVDSADDFRVEGCTFAYNNVERFQYAWEAAGIKVVRSRRTLLRGNVAERNYGNAIWLDVANNDAVVVRNRCRDNDDNGIFFEISRRAILAFNVCDHNRGSGILVSNACDAWVYNNTCVDNKHGLQFLYWERPNDTGSELDGVPVGTPFPMRGNVARNNVLWYAGADAGATLLDAVGWPKTPGAGPDSAARVADLGGNGYYRARPGVPRAAVTWNLPGEKSAREFATVAAFRTTLGRRYEADAAVVDGGPDPFFLAAAARDYRPRPGKGKPAPLTFPPDIAAAAGIHPGAVVRRGALQH